MELATIPKSVSPLIGRKSNRLRFKNLEKAIKKIDDNLIKAIEVVVDGLRDPDCDYRLKCAELIIKKAIPDKKIKEIIGDPKKPISIQVDKRIAVLEIVRQLDGMDLNEIKNGKLQITREEKGSLSATATGEDGSEGDGSRDSGDE